MITTHVFRTILRDALRPFNERFTRASELEHRRGSCPPQTDPRGTDSILLLACAAVHRKLTIEQVDPAVNRSALAVAQSRHHGDSSTFSQSIYEDAAPRR